MTDSAEVILANAVKDWVEKIVPGDEPTAEAAVSTALALFVQGASVSEACQEARRRVLSRLRHPSYVPVDRRLLVAS